jgi:hypothetical protein
MFVPATLFAAGKIYTWTDEEGNVHYGDRPPMEADAEEIRIQGTKKAPVEVDENMLPGQWFGTEANGGEVKLTINASGTINFIQTRTDQSVYNYQGIWTYADNSLTVITEFTQTAPANGDFQRSVEPLQLKYNIIRFAGEEMEMIIGEDRFTVSKLNL